MAKKKRVYWWWYLLVLFLGFLIFGISLLVAMSATRLAMHEEDRVIYFDRKVLPDHLFYPLIVAVDRLELEFAQGEEKTVLRLDYGKKRLAAARALFEQEKPDLALSTLTKAHQYLYQANLDVLAMKDKGKFLTFLVKLNQEFAQEYQSLREYMDDAARANLDRMLEELAGWQQKL